MGNGGGRWPEQGALARSLRRLRRSPWGEPVRNLLVAIVAVVAFWLTVHPADGEGRTLRFALGFAAMSGAMLSSRFPKSGVLLSFASTAAAWLLGFTVDPFVVTGIALFTYAERRGSRLFPRGLILGTAALLAVSLTLGVNGVDDRVHSGLISSGVLAASWVLGVRTRQARLAAAAKSRTEERMRLARDVHDALSHSLGTIGVLAGVSAHVATLGEESLRSTLKDIEGSARSGMQELKALLQKERESSAAVTEASIEHDASTWCLTEAISSLASGAVKVGLQTSVETSGDLNGLPPMVRTTVHRISQEMLTNVIRHASATAVEISISVTETRVEIRIADNGKGRARDIDEGHGLAGMRERARLLGGTVTIDSHEGGGIAVDVVLPATLLERQRELG